MTHHAKCVAFIRQVTLILLSHFTKMDEIGQTRSILGTRVQQWMAGTAERICAKFTQKTCLVLRSDELECQGQKSNGQKTHVQSQHPHSMDEMERPRCR